MLQSTFMKLHTIMWNTCGYVLVQGENCRGEAVGGLNPQLYYQPPS